MARKYTKTVYPITWRKDYTISKNHGGYIVISGNGYFNQYLYYSLQEAKRLFKNKYIK